MDHHLPPGRAAVVCGALVFVAVSLAAPPAVTFALAAGAALTWCWLLDSRYRS